MRLNTNVDRRRRRCKSVVDEGFEKAIFRTVFHIVCLYRWEDNSRHIHIHAHTHNTKKPKKTRKIKKKKKKKKNEKKKKKGPENNCRNKNKDEVRGRKKHIDYET